MVAQQTQQNMLFASPDEDFGALIERIRRRSRIQIKEIVALFPTYLNEQICGKKWDRFTYTHLVGERKRRPRLQELLPLYKCLVLAGVHFSAAERNHLLFLAWQIIEEPAERDLFPVEGRWAKLRSDFAVFDQLPEPEKLGIYPAELRPVLGAPFLQEDHRHLVGRESWVNEMQKHLLNLPKKLVIIQATLGAGKSSALHLLRRSLEEIGGYRLFFFTCVSPSNITAEEQLDRFLADTFASLRIEEKSEDEHCSYLQRVQILLKHLAQTNTQTILFVDNGEVLLEARELAACWQQFFLDFVKYQHTGTLFFATRAWPGWKGRNRTYIALNKLPPLSPEAGAVIWRRMGFDDVEELLLQQMSIRCGGNPWLIELRASTTLHDMPIETGNEKHSAQENEHTRFIKYLLQQPRTLFGNETDYETQQILQEVIGTHLSPQGLLLLDILACSSVALPLLTLKDHIPQVEAAFEELQHASLVDLDVKIYTHRAQLLPVVSEAALQQQGSQERRKELDEIVRQVYTQWLKQGIPSDQEKSAVIAELTVFSLTQLDFLNAAERVIRSSWSLTRFGHITRIARTAHSLMERESWHTTTEQECGGLLLRYYLAPFLGQKLTTEARTQVYQRIYNALLQEQIHLQEPTELYLVHLLMAYHRDALHFHEAQAILDQTFDRHRQMEQTHPHRFASLLGRRAALLGTWSEYADEQGQQKEAAALREQAIIGFRQCINLWEQCEEQTPTAKSTYKYRRARHLNDLCYYLRMQGGLDQALEALEQSLDLKTAGYVEPGSLATSYSEKAQCLAAMGQFRKALHFDQLAVDDIRQAAASGNSLLQEDVGVYLVERGILYLRLGRLKEAKPLLQQASSTLSDDRRSHRTKAQQALTEIQQWQQTSPNGQLDWRWSTRYRKIVRYDPFRWLTPAAFCPAEEEEWLKLQDQETSEQQQKRLEELLAHSRDREVISALSEQREPRLQYPCIPITEVVQKMTELHTLATDIEKDEPNTIVRRLYLDIIDEHLSYLQMIEATHSSDVAAFKRHNRAIHTEPTSYEMERALSHVTRLIELGKQRTETAEVSEQLILFLQSVGIPFVPTMMESDSRTKKTASGASMKTHLFAPATVKRFFDAVMSDYGFDGWQTVIDSTTNDPRIEQLTQELILPDKPLSAASIRSLLSHEIESHVFRAAAGAKSALDLLATGTRRFMATEEGLALYYDRKTALVQGKVVEEFTAGSLFGTLSTGLASGVLGSPLTFSRLYAFLELFLFLYRTINGLDKDVQKARVKAQNLARQRCLRTFRGVPDLSVAGAAYLKDSLYYRGEQMVSAAIEQDNQKLIRLIVGVVGLEQLDDLEELGITEPPYQPRWLAHDPDLASRILSFEKV